MASGIPGLGDSDPYRHLAYSAALWHSHLQLRGNPALPYTIQSARWAAAFGVGALALVATLAHLVTGWSLGTSFYDPPRTFDALAEEVRARVPSGNLLFTLDPFVTSVLYAWLPDYRYAAAYDNALLFLYDPARFWAWDHAGRDFRFCQQRSCPPGAPQGAAAVAQTLALFDTDVLLTRAGADAELERTLARAPQLFTSEAVIDAPVSGHWTLWRFGGGAGQRR